MIKDRRKRFYCPNCRSQLDEDMNFCFSCGQENNIKRVSVKMLLNDIFSGYFTVDSKLFITLKLLISKPSLLSVAYLNGQIETFIKPIRLYIFISFIFFLLSANITSYTKTIEKINLALNEMPMTIGDLESGFEESENSIEQKDNSLDKKIEKIFSTERETTIFFNYLLAKFPIVLFGMIPVLGFLFYAFFFKAKYYYIDHFIFSLHLQCFLLILLIIASIANWLFTIDINFLALIGVLIYGYIATIKFYKKKKRHTFFRLCLIGLIHAVLIMIVCVLFFLLAMQTYSL